VFLVIAIVELVALLAIPAPANPDKPGVSGGIRTAAAELRGEGPPVDLVQDYVGARSLVLGGDAYEVLTQAYASVGLAWPAEHRSTHPPTAFLLVLPVAWLPWKAAAAVWAALMLGAIAAFWWALGVGWELAAALGPATLVWPPAAWSLGQLTPLWLLGIALAWRWRRHSARAGAAVALAALTKFLPALSLAPFVVIRRTRAVIAFALVWIAALAALLVLDPGVIKRYLSVSNDVATGQAARGENAALLAALSHNYGVAGVAAGIVLVAAVLLTSVRRLRSPVETVDEWSWWAWSWIGVALLPIAWIYSLLPLLPALRFCARRGGLVARALAAFAVAAPFTIDPFGLPGARILAASIAAVGVALLVLAYGPGRLSA
jgi:hypothetical protein